MCVQAAEFTVAASLPQLDAPLLEVRSALDLD